jgi:hypothetical protein
VPNIQLKPASFVILNGTKPANDSRLNEAAELSRPYSFQVRSPHLHSNMRMVLPERGFSMFNTKRGCASHFPHRRSSRVSLPESLSPL